MKYVIIIAFLVVCGAFPIRLQGQAPFKEFILKIKSGLSSDRIYQTTSDEYGNIFVATNRGLCLYDGYRFIKNPYVKGAVLNLFHKDTVLYFYSSDRGLCSIRNIFDSVNVIRPVNFTDSIPENDHYEHVYVDAGGRIWCTDFHNIKYFDPENGTFRNYLWDRANKNINAFLVFCEPRAGTLWVFSHKGLWVWDKNRQQFHLHPDPRLNRLSYAAVYFDESDCFYLATTDGKLLSYDMRNNALHLLPPLPEGEVPLFINRIFIQNRQRILFCTEHKLYVFNAEEQIYELWYQADKAEIKGLTVNDALHLVWLSTNRGLRKLRQYPEALQTLYLPEKTSKPVTSIIKDGWGNIWSSAAGNKIWKYNVAGKWECFSLPGSKNIRCSTITIFGSVILAATSEGLYQFRSGKFIKCVLEGLPNETKVDKAIIDQESRLWVMAAGNPIRVFEWPSLRFKKDFILNAEPFWQENVFNDIIQNADGKIWFAAWMPRDFGIAFYNPESRKIEGISSWNDRGLFMGDYYRKIALAPDGGLLFSGFGGWNLVTAHGQIKKTLNTVVYDVASNHVEGISADSSSNIWFATSEGLYKYDFKIDKVLRLSQTDGLPTDELTNGYSAFPDGELALGLDGAILLVDQQKIIKSPLVNKFILTAIKINGAWQEPKSEIKLENEQTDLTLYFSALTFAEEEKIIYRYRFEEDTGWVYLGNSPELYLARLKHGHYKIVFQAGDHLNHWQQKQLVISLYVPAPFYKTIWFLSLVLIFVGFLTFLINRYLFRQQKLKEQLQSRLKDAEMEALRSQMNPHFLFNTLNSINSYIIRNQTENASEYLTMFAKLMRNILSNSKQSLIRLKKEMETLKLYLELEGMRLEHSFDYTIKVEKGLDMEEINIPPLILQPFVENAIWHGLHNKNKDGNLEIDLQKISERKIKIVITDNGIGRAAASLIKKGQTQHKSFGMEITVNRLQLLNIDNTVEVIDLFDKYKCAAGTNVVILLNF